EGSVNRTTKLVERVLDLRLVGSCDFHRAIALRETQRRILIRHRNGHLFVRDLEGIHDIAALGAKLGGAHDWCAGVIGANHPDERLRADAWAIRAAVNEARDG